MADALTAASVAAAADAGRAAFGGGVPVTACPHPAGSTLAVLWVRGWTGAQLAGRPQ
jgi:hypothetical protein